MEHFEISDEWRDILEKAGLGTLQACLAFDGFSEESGQRMKIVTTATMAKMMMVFCELVKSMWDGRRGMRVKRYGSRFFWIFPAGLRGRASMNWTMCGIL